MMETLSTWFGAISFTAALTAAGALLGVWIIWLESDKKQFVWKLGCAAAIVGVLGVFCSILDELHSQSESVAAEKRIGGLETAAKIAEQKMSAANARAEGLQGRLNAAEGRLSTRAERVTPETSATLVKTLAATSNKVPLKVWIFDDPESAELAETIILPALNLAGWQVTEAQRIGIWFPTTVGLQVQYLAPDLPDCTEEFANAFTALGVGEVQTVAAPGGLFPKEGTLFLYIGNRPLPSK